MFIATSLSPKCYRAKRFQTGTTRLSYRGVVPTEVAIEQVTAVDGELLAAYERLLPQLSRTADADEEILQHVIASPATTLLVARRGSQIVGMCTLATFYIPTGVRSWIEDVVVDKTARGLGIGTALVEAAVHLAGEARARSVDLTSRPERAEANLLYQRLGFNRRQTNVYRLELDG
jgi:ribosomal protein S18 acetylase RimI-like enzyme